MRGRKGGRKVGREEGRGGEEGRLGGGGWRVGLRGQEE